MAQKFSRRGFLQVTAGVVPFFIGKNCFSAVKGSARCPLPSEKVNLALIGCGTQMFDNSRQFLADERVKVTVTCDPVYDAPLYNYNWKCQGGCGAFKRIVDEKYGNHDCRAVLDYREVLDDPTVDAVCIATPDHWHAPLAIAAMRKGKHVYVQKPMTVSIAEGRAMAEVQKETGVTLQVGNQGRASSLRRVGAELAVNGYVGKIVAAKVTLPHGADYCHRYPESTIIKPRPFPTEFFKSKELWDLWQGPAEHWADDGFIPALHYPMNWRWNNRYGGGMMTDFGGHEFDTLQWGLDKNFSGPVAIKNFKCWDFSTYGPREIFSFAGSFDFDIVYADGCVAHVSNIVKDDPKTARQVIFVGEKGEEVGFRGSTMVRPERLKKWKESDLKPTERPLYAPKDRHSHESDFIDGIYENRPIGTCAEIGHRVSTVSHLANICEKLGLSEINWDPVAEKFTGPNADACNAEISRTYRNGFKLI